MLFWKAWHIKLANNFYQMTLESQKAEIQKTAKLKAHSEQNTAQFLCTLLFKHLFLWETLTMFLLPTASRHKLILIGQEQITGVPEYGHPLYAAPASNVQRADC